MKKVKIGFLGLGVVGQGVWKHISRNKETLQQKLGVKLELSKAVVSDLKRKRHIRISQKKMSLDPDFVLKDPDIQIVCELVGGVTQAKKWIEQALRAGKCVVTANKALICEYGESLFALAHKNGVRLFYEASVAGGIPVIKTLREGLVANRIENIHGILNGTSNYILTRMEEENSDFPPILEAARKLGYVEADEALDLDGIDAAHKTVILAYLALGHWVSLKSIKIEGIRNISLSDIQLAKEFGYRIKLVAHICPNFSKKSVFVGVFPTLLPETYPMAKVDQVFNAVSITGDVLGTTTLVGRGAGQDATASSVISDIADSVLALKNSHQDQNGAILQDLASDFSITPMDQVQGCFYLRLKVVDQPGVLAKIASVMARYQISIARMIQKSSDDSQNANLIFTTHKSNEKAITQVSSHLARLKIVQEKPLLIRIFEPANT